jgi:hypothetical protein
MALDRRAILLVFEANLRGSGLLITAAQQTVYWAALVRGSDEMAAIVDQ